MTTAPVRRLRIALLALAVVAASCGDDVAVSPEPVAGADASADTALGETVAAADAAGADVAATSDAGGGTGDAAGTGDGTGGSDGTLADVDPVTDADATVGPETPTPDDTQPGTDAVTPDDTQPGTDAVTPDDTQPGTDAVAPADAQPEDGSGTDAATPDDVQAGSDAALPEDSGGASDVATPDDVQPGSDAASPGDSGGTGDGTVEDAGGGSDAAPGDSGAPDDASPDVPVVVKPSAQLCNPCNATAECGDGGACVSHGDAGSFCGMGCKAEGDCPSGFACKGAATVDKQTAQQCVPAAAAGAPADAIGACTCNDDAVAKGLKTACTYSADGKCKFASTSTCAKAGEKPTACAPVAPGSEVCNGIDDNCDGQTDEAIACDDKNPCTKDACGAAGNCTNTPSDGACDDGDSCTEGDTCAAGACTAGKAKVCADDGNPCTDDKCAKDKGCVSDSAEGKPCTATDGVCATGTCQASKCVVVAGATCDDKNPCTKDTCDAKTGKCDYAPDGDGATCDDGTACTDGDVCGGGKCAGKAVACDDGNPCTTDSCDAQKGCVSANNNGAGCNDGDLCTTGDACKDGKCATGLPVACTSTDACSVAACNKSTGMCVSTPAADGAACDDTNACTSGDTCTSGACGGKTLNCDDGNACTDDQCNPAKGCAQAPNSDPCEDGNACTGGDACANGTCKAGKPNTCDDKNPCTADSCDPKTGACANSNQAGACDDGKVCTTSDACTDGACTGTPDACDDGNPCTTDSCDPKAGCQHAPGQGVCDDGDACTVKDACVNGKCAGTAGQIVCDDKNACTSDGCDAKAGCVFANNANACDDGNACTDKDTCKDGKCQPGVATCQCKTTADCAKLEDGNLCNGTLVCDTGTCKVDQKTVVVCGTTGNTECSQQQCEAATGKCGLKAVSDGTQCNADSSVCTVGDACAAGKCAPGKPQVCDDKNVCTKDACDAIKGCVATALTGTVCDDGSQCTATDTCKDGKCSGTIKVCDDNNVCTNNTCDPASGCAYPANTAPCSDGNACTLQDLCKDKACAAGAAKNCSDNNICTNDSCNKASGACGYALADGVTCTDGNACTNPDKCLAAKCVAGAAKVCNDNQQCTADSCNTTTGNCTFAPIIGCGGNCAKNSDCPSDGNPCTNEICDALSKKCATTLATDGTPCDDGSACTALESCLKGKCTGGKVTSCDDANACTADVCLPQTGGCAHNNQAGACQDGNACTNNDLCVQGTCQPGAAVACNDNNPCTTDSCDKVTGKCSNTAIVGCAATCAIDKDCPASSDPCIVNFCDLATKKCASKSAANLTVCDDKSLCTALDLCVGGKCTGQNPKVCNDSNGCTDDLCDPKSGLCVSTNNTAQCSDGNGCTGPDVCKDGKCGAGPSKVCNDNNACTTDSCATANGNCVFTPIGGCGNYCYKTADCKEDTNPCTTATCNTNNKQCYFALVANDTQCDDGNGCSAVSFCKNGYCQGGNIKVCNESNVCTSDACDTKNGACVFTALSTGSCTDNAPCTVGDTCQNGACAPGAAKVCNDNNACTTDACDKATGNCTYTPIGGCGNYCYKDSECKDDGNVCTATVCNVTTKQCTHPPVTVVTSCSDGKPCTVGDACTGGVCTPTGPKACTDNNACTADLCEPNTGNCLFVNQDGKGCDDNVPCTVQDACVAGKCAGVKKNCDDGKTCTADSCDAKTGVCLHTPIVGCGGNCAVDKDCKDDGNVCTVEYCNANKKCDVKDAADGTTCSDGLLCTDKDVCKAGACAGTAKTCNDNNVCTDDKCDPAKGTCFVVNNTAACEDGNLCTVNDFCSQAKCTTGSNKNCDDGKKCTTDTCDGKSGACVHTPIAGCN